MPTGGGVAVWLGVVLPLAVLAAVGAGDVGASAGDGRPGAALVLCAATAMGLIGLVDDLRPRGWKAKLAAQAFVAGALVVLRARLEPAPLGPENPGMSLPLAERGTPSTA